tara:strand:- start:1772 stop:3175 length:1404 start_codon:yes stop_codon:yes gene_type:complete
MNEKIRHAIFLSTLTLGTFGTLALAGCSESDDPVSQEQEQTKSIAQIAAMDETFSTLVAALEAADLVETLAAEGNYTVFAPTNAAFEALPAGTVDALLADPTGDLTKILLNHVINAEVSAAEVVTLTEATTLQGDKVMIEVVDGEVILNGTVKVISTDIMANNGIIHVIDGILLPDLTTEVVEEEEEEEEVDTTTLTITEIAASIEDFSTLVTALQAAELDGVLNGTDNYTVFAPTNAAFGALPEGTLETLLADPTGDLADILLYHVVGAKVPAADVVGLDYATTAQGSKVTIEVVDGKVILNGTTEVTSTDIMAKNGIIHVIDAVILPSDAPMSITDIASSNADLETLTAAVTAAGLATTLSEAGNYTVFAPTDAAFDALPAGTLDALLADAEGALKDVLLYHVIDSEVNAGEVVKLTEATTLNGAKISIEVVDGKVILDGTSEVIITDIIASNGIVHVIDAVITP